MRCHKPDVVCDRSSFLFGNPHLIGRDGTRDEVCEKFIPHFYNKLRDPVFRDKVLALKGKRLGCEPHCGNSKCKVHRCHVQTIVEYIENET